MLRDLVRRASSTGIGAVVLAVAALIATIAAAFAVYAGLVSLTSPALAGGGTALLFALVVVIIAAATPNLLGVNASPEARKRAVQDPAGATMMMEVAAMTAGILSEIMLDRRANKASKRKQKRKSAAEKR